MFTIIYLEHKKRRGELIKKLYKKIAQETINNKIDISIKFRIHTIGKASYCGERKDRQGVKYIVIVLALNGIANRVKKGYTNHYYNGRAEYLNGYIKHNRHNTLRFILYHEARHAHQRLNNIRESMSKETAERDADEWAIKHLKGAK